MILIKIIAYACLITYTLAIGIYYLRVSGLGNWLVMSINYPFRKRRINKLFKLLGPNDRLSLWQSSVEIEDQTKWYFRKLELFIRNKYITPILKEHGEI